VSSKLTQDLLLKKKAQKKDWRNRAFELRTNSIRSNSRLNDNSEGHPFELSRNHSSIGKPLSSKMSQGKFSTVDDHRGSMLPPIQAISKQGLRKLDDLS